MEQQQEQSNKQHELDLLDKKTQLEQMKQDREDDRTDSKNETDIRVAEIQSLSKSPDINHNNIPDVTEVANLALKERKLNLEEKNSKINEKKEQDKLELEKQKLKQKSNSK